MSQNRHHILDRCIYKVYYGKEVAVSFRDMILCIIML